MRVAILTGGFPSEDNPSKSIFNFRAVAGLQKYTEVVVFHFRFWIPGRKAIQRKFYRGIEVVVVALPWIPITISVLNAFNLLIWQRLATSLLCHQLKNFDILHSIGLETSIVTAAIAKKNKQKHVAQAIGSDLLIYLPKMEKFFALKNWVFNTNMVVCNSVFLMRKLLKRYPQLCAKTLYRGTDLSAFKNKGFSYSKNIKLVYVGGFSNRRGSGLGPDLKGGETLKKVWKSFDEKESLNAVLQMAGPLSLDNEQIKWRNNLNHPDRVELKGLLPPENIPELLNNADIVLIPSKSEGLPNVAVEACAAGALVIASNVGGIPEVINEDTGILLEPDDTENWIEMLENVLGNWVDYKHFTVNARANVEAKFNADLYPVNLIQVYNSLN